MNTSKITLNNTEFEGTLDFYVIRKIQEDLKKSGFNNKVYDIFKNISNIENLNNEESILTIVSLVLNSISRQGYLEEDIEREFILEKNLKEYFERTYEYINNLIEKCMPINNNKQEEEYEVPDWYSPKDWDFDEMEYMWYSILRRSDDFYKVTPKTFFTQMDIYEKVNSSKR